MHYCKGFYNWAQTQRKEKQTGAGGGVVFLQLVPIPSGVRLVQRPEQTFWKAKPGPRGVLELLPDYRWVELGPGPSDGQGQV